MNEQVANNWSPNEQLAEIVTSRLVSEGIIPESLRQQVFTGLANGNLKSTDWQLYISMKLKVDQEGTSNDQED